MYGLLIEWLVSFLFAQQFFQIYSTLVLLDPYKVTITTNWPLQVSNQYFHNDHAKVKRYLGGSSVISTPDTISATPLRCLDSSHSILEKWINNVFFFKNGPIPASFSVYFRLFNMLQFKLKKRRWCAWESNPGRQDGRRERIHWATAAPQ